jgi:Domain of unknown function (DUF4124)/WXXGXW repeat (2 copies)
MCTNTRLRFWTASGADRRAALLIAIALLACPTVALRAGEIYKSVDAEGHVVYSDRPDTSIAAQSAVQIPSSDDVTDIEEQAAHAPPPLPDNPQPPCPDEGYLWTPGYWAWNPAGYYWIPGAWVQPPQADVLWTPGYWESVGAFYVFHRGYWAQHIGYYGGINYGFGYFGVGFAGGRWLNHAFVYNRAVSNVDARVIHHTYSESVTSNAASNRVSYNGGPGGTTSLMTARERALAPERHFPALMPHMPISVYHTERSADQRIDGASQRSAMLNTPAVAGPRATATPSFARQHEIMHAPAKAPSQPAVARPSKPVTTRPASSKMLSPMPSPK